MSAPMTPGEWAAIMEAIARDVADESDKHILVPEYRLEMTAVCPECGASGPAVAYYGPILDSDGVTIHELTREEAFADVQDGHDSMCAPCTAKVEITVVNDTGPLT